MSDEFWKQFFTFLGLIVVGITSYLNLRATKVNNAIGMQNASKLDDAATKVVEAKDQVEEVRKLANGQLSEVKEEVRRLTEENHQLKAQLGQRRSTDA